MRAPITCRVASLIGTANPRPTPATAVLMPTTRPKESTRAPPELPGFSAASVWITLSIIRSVLPDRAGSERPSAEITPAVTEPAKPFGLPIATTSCPTRRPDASPRTAEVRSSASARSSARSDRGSAPTTRKPISRPSTNVARPTRPRPATTWAEVSRKPSGVSTTALPAPTGTCPRRVARSTRRLATLGARRSTTPETVREYASSASASAAEPPGSASASPAGVTPSAWSSCSNAAPPAT